MKRGGPGQGGARTIIGQLGDSFLWFNGQGSYCQDVWSASDEHCQDVEYANVHPVHPQLGDIQKLKNINAKFDYD